MKKIVQLTEQEWSELCVLVWEGTDVAEKENLMGQAASHLRLIKAAILRMSNQNY